MSRREKDRRYYLKHIEKIKSRSKKRYQMLRDGRISSRLELDRIFRDMAFQVYGGGEVESAFKLAIEEAMNLWLKKYIPRQKDLRRKEGYISWYRSELYKKKTREGERVEGSLGLNGLDTAIKLVRILAGQKKTEYDKYDDGLIDKGRNWRLREMKRMSVDELNRLYNCLDFLQKLISDILPILDKEAETREEMEKDGIFRP
jgi:hypothetical protein